MCIPVKTKSIVLSGIIALLVVVSGAVRAESATTTKTDNQTQKVYKTVGPNGEIIYSDKPSPGSKAITVPLDGGYKAVKPPSSFTPYQPPRTSRTTAVKNTVRITSPADQATIRSGEGDLSISVSVGKALGPNQSLVYKIDGKTVYTGSATSYSLKNVYRGTHVITVQITDPSGGTLTSAPVTVYMKRPFKKK